MAEKPIIFSTPMVRAILDGRKTQSRRVIKGDILPGWDQEWQTPCYLKIRDGKAYGNVIRTPYRPGDVLWIRETFNRMFNRIENKFDYWHKAGNDFEDDYDERWRPSIHMPREAARIFLKITDVRVERLQDITDEDVLSEGFKMDNPAIFLKGYQGAFQGLWDSLNAKRGYSWESNPWVWVYSFQRLENYSGGKA